MAGTTAVVVTGRLITMDPDRPEADAAAIVDGRIAAIGSRGDAVAACPAGTPVLPLPGTVVPGFIDSHVHMLWAGGNVDRVDLAGVRSLGEIAERIGAFAAAHPDRPWLAGSGDFDAEQLAEGRLPTHAELEAATGGRPLFLDRRAHDALANTTALRLAGIDATTPDPPGGEIERDADGAPTGLLVERPAAELAERAMPAPTVEDRLPWLRAIQPQFHAAGLTTVVDPALRPHELAAYEAAEERGELTMRTTAMPLGDGEVPPEELMRTFEDHGLRLDRAGDVLRIGPTKLFLDGGGSLATALLREPWPGTDGYHGNQTTATAALHAYAAWAAETGVGLGVHCVGGAAIDLTLEAFAAAAARRPLAGLGFTLIHAYLWPSAENMARARELGVLVATQAPLQYAFGAGLIRRFGVEAVGRAHPLRSWLAAGVAVGGGSDGPGAAISTAPLFALWQMQRRTVGGHDGPVGLDEAIDARQALALYTTGAAEVARASDRGRLAPGCVADLVALDVDPLRASPEACRDGRVLLTMVGGRIVHDDR